MPVQQEFDPALPRRRRQRLIAARTRSLRRRRNPRASIDDRAARERQPFDLKAEEFRLADENFQGCLLCADNARSADQRFEEGEGAFGLRVNGSIKRLEHSRRLVCHLDHMSLEARRQVPTDKMRVTLEIALLDAADAKVGFTEPECPSTVTSCPETALPEAQ
jgi:hypothetical protein